MDNLIELDPNLKQKAELLTQIKKRVLFKEIASLDSHLSVFNLSLFKQLLEKDFYSNESLKETYKQIVREEQNPVEKLLFQMLSNKKILFSDCNLYFLFCKEFPGFLELFMTDGSFNIEELIFRKIYLHSKEDEKIQNTIRNSPFKEQILCFVILNSLIDQKFMMNRLLELKNEQENIKINEKITEAEFVKFWVLGLRCLPSNDFYRLISSEFLYSTYISKVNIYRALIGIANFEKVSICMMNACFTNSFSIIKTYIVFLKVIELFKLSYEFKLKLLFCWLRFFMAESHLDLFLDLIKNLKKSKKLDEEFEIYLEIEKYLQEGTDYESLETKINNFRDLNEISNIKITDLLKVLRKQ